MTGLYLHIPFCARKCPYCDFYSVSFSRQLAERYTDALVRNIKAFAARQISIDTIYFGGGTPSLLCSSQVGRIIQEAMTSFRVTDPEITLEANPCTTYEQKLYEYRQAGVNRLSFGVQSADDRELKLLGRLHDFKRAEKAVLDAKKAGFENISCDLMLGTAGQTLGSLEKSLDALTSLPVEHISAYMLKIEKGTAYDCDEMRNASADDELVSEMYLRAVEKLAKAGFEQYEISNFAKKGFESRHNLKYWTGESYIGLGASAHSLFDGKRYFCPNDIDSFVSIDIQQTVIEDASPDKAQEYVMLGLRLTKGISIEKLRKLGTDPDRLREKAALFENAGLCRLCNDRIFLTPQGFLLSNSIIAEFIGIM